MSWEAWGDDDAGDYDHLIEAGWWTSEQVDEVREAIRALQSTPMFAAGKWEGLSPEWLKKLEALAAVADVDAPEGKVT